MASASVSPSESPSVSLSISPSSSESPSVSLSLSGSASLSPSRSVSPSISPSSSVSRSASASRSGSASLSKSASLSPSGSTSRSVSPSAGDLFCDGFESGDFSAWSSTSTPDADFVVSGAAALEGSYGFSLTINSLGGFTVSDSTPNSETRYRIHFKIDTHGITFPDSSSNILLTNTNNNLLQVRFRQYTGFYRISARTTDDASTLLETAVAGISDSVHDIEVDWKASSAPGANDGFITLYVNGIEIDSLTSLDNDTKSITSIQFGCVSINNAAISGTFYLDSFCSNNDGESIGWIASGSASLSPSASLSISPSASLSPSGSLSPSASVSPSVSPSVSRSVSPSISRSVSPSVSRSISESASASPSVAPAVQYGPRIQFMS